jgi:hypothetical protein
MIALDRLQGPTTFSVRTNQNPTSSIVTEFLGNLLLFHYNPTDLPVVFHKAYFRALGPESPLQRVQNILETIVDIMNVESLSLAQIKQDHNFELIVWFVSNSSFARSIKNIAQNLLAPLIPIFLIRGKDGADCASVPSHVDNSVKPKIYSTDRSDRIPIRELNAYLRYGSAQSRPP